jgi:uncharacterized membrane protein (GlpM family)
MMDKFPFRRRGGLWLFAAIFCIYMLSMSRERPWGDATPLWEVADNIAHEGTIAIKTRWPATLLLGRGGKVYGVAPVLQAAIHIPGAVLQRLAQKHVPRQAALAWRFTCHLAPVLLGALTCVLFFGLCRRLGAKPAAAALTTIALGLGSTLWVYSRYTYSEVLQTACFTGFFAQLLETRRNPSRRSGALLGMWAGLLVNSKYIYIVSAAGGAIYLLAALRGRWRVTLETAVAATVAALPFAALALLYNYARWSDPFAAGYDLSSEAGIRENVAVGLWGMFLSPGKSVFLYSPPLLASLIGLRRAIRRWPQFLPAALLTVAPPLLVYARLIFWSGDYAWGPRYLVFAVPVMLLPACALVDHLVVAAHSRKRVLAAGALGALLLAGGFVQYLGNAFYWDHFIRIQSEAARAWLGTPNIKGNCLGEGPHGSAACFEAMHPMQWLPPFQPIVGHYWMLRHVPNDDNWMVAEKDAPWHRYTSAQLNIAASWNRARLDWWFVEFRHSNPQISWVLLFLLPLLALLSFALFFRELCCAARTRPAQAGLASVLPQTGATTQP